MSDLHRHELGNWKIKKVSGHKSNAVLDRYIRAARLFEDSPLEGMF